MNCNSVVVISYYILIPNAVMERNQALIVMDYDPVIVICYYYYTFGFMFIVKIEIPMTLDFSSGFRYRLTITYNILSELRDI